MNVRWPWLLGGVVALTLAACDLGLPEGRSRPTPYVPDVTCIAGPCIPTETTKQPSVTLVPEEPTTSLHAATGGALVTCALPETAGYPFLLEPGANIPLAASDPRDARACLDSKEQSEDFCYFVQTLELRYRALVDCHNTVISALAKGRSTEEFWAILPPTWATLLSREAKRELGRVSRSVTEQVHGGFGPAVAADPLCLAKAPTEAPGAAVTRAFTVVRGTWQARVDREKALAGLLRRGLAADLPGGGRVAITVRLVEQPTWLPQSRSCSFDAVPAPR